MLENLRNTDTVIGVSFFFEHINYVMVLVLDAGLIKEFSAPQTLLK